jgi:hypothetical protein
VLVRYVRDQVAANSLAGFEIVQSDQDVVLWIELKSAPHTQLNGFRKFQESGENPTATAASWNFVGRTRFIVSPKTFEPLPVKAAIFWGDGNLAQSPGGRNPGHSLPFDLVVGASC